MNAEKHFCEKERLNQALSGKLDPLVDSMKNLLKEYNIDLMPGVAYDTCCYVLEELHLDKFNLPKW
ncbi:hypothetical protein AALB39_26035 [Lachnospiraceae bacterium 54-53]